MKIHKLWCQKTYIGPGLPCTCCDCDEEMRHIHAKLKAPDPTEERIRVREETKDLNKKKQEGI